MDTLARRTHAHRMDTPRHLGLHRALRMVQRYRMPTLGRRRRVPRKVPHAAQLSGIMVPGECRRRLRTKAPRSVRTARSGNCSRQPMARLRSRRIGARRISPHCHTQPRRHRMLQPRSGIPLRRSDRTGRSRGLDFGQRAVRPR